MRHPTRAAIDKFNECLGLIEDPHMQDWELECADPDRVEEFLDCYDAHAKDADEKFTLMALILGSFEDFHGLEPPSDKQWQRIMSVLSEDLELHRDHIENYQCLDAESDDECFPITPLMRQIKISKRPEQVSAGNPLDAQ